MLTAVDTLIRFPTQGSLATHRLLCHNGVRTYEEMPEIDPSQMRIATEEELKALEEARTHQCRRKDCGMIFNSD